MLDTRLRSLVRVEFVTEASVIFASLQDFKVNQKEQDSRLFVVPFLVTNHSLMLS